jgi:hypothetical protein
VARAATGLMSPKYWATLAAALITGISGF